MATANLFNREVKASKSPRNAFDVGYCTLFNSPIGRLLPAYVEEVKAGDKLKLSLSNITRTRPLNTSAFMSFDEKVDFWYVPYNLLWSSYEQWRLAQNFPHSSTDLREPGSQILLPSTPFPSEYVLSFKSFSTFQYDDFSKFTSSNPSPCLADFYQMMDLLMYGVPYQYNYSKYSWNDVYNSQDPALVFLKDFYLALKNKLGSMNYFRLAAFQCIYMHHYRNEEYEKLDPSYYNCDSLFLTKLSYDNGLPFAGSVSSPSSLSTVPDSHDSSDVPLLSLPKLFTPRFKNWRRDIFTSVKPNSGFNFGVSGFSQGFTPQFGSSLAWPSDTMFDVSDGSGNSAEQTNNPYPGTVFGVGVTSNNGSRIGGVYLQNGSPYQPLPVMNVVDSSGNPIDGRQYVNLLPQSIRNLMASDKFVRSAIYADKNYESQMKSIFGLNVDDPHQPRYLGSYSTTIQISDVVATSAGTDGDADASTSILGEIAGKGYNSDGGNVFESSFDRDGIVMGIHYLMPRNNYDSCRINRFNVKTSRFDYFYPQFDGLGLQPVYMFERNLSFDTINPQSTQVGSLFGYAPRYFEYKQRTNEVHGSFMTNQPDYDWTLSNNPFPLVSGNLFWNYKINPILTNRLFSVAYDGSDQTAPFQHFYQFNVTRVSDMEVFGTPNI